MIRQECLAVQLEAFALLQRSAREATAAANQSSGNPELAEVARQIVEARQEAAAALMGDAKLNQAIPFHGDSLVLVEGWPMRDPRNWYQRIVLPSLADRLRAWQALAIRLAQYRVAPPAGEVDDLHQQYDYLKAWQAGMAVKIGVYMAIFVILGGVGTQVAEVLKPLPNAATTNILGSLHPYIAAVYWGAVGASASSLYRLIREASKRALRLEDVYDHALKPLLGGVLGLLVMVLSPVLAGGTVPSALAGKPLSLVLILAAICGISESAFFERVKAVTVSLLGGAKEPVATKTP
ncbi:MAG TPA: hypothetical protein VGK74_17155 [Symbiobacteriaceae bacterium]